jgi:peptidoglycan/LPS O-acetylase OafA/YrhL
MRLGRITTDAVRGFAALLVVFLHLSSLIVPQQIWIEKTYPVAFLLPWLFRSEVAVGVFIFLSGFLLTLSRIEKSENWAVFFIRRVLRIYPVYIPLLIVAISISRQWDFHGFINAILLLPNFPGTLWPYPYLSTAWSLGVEWTLYLFFPFLVFLLRFNFKALLLMMMIIQIAIIYGVIIGSDLHTLVYGSILGRSLQFMLGIVCAFHYQKASRWFFEHKIVFFALTYIPVHLWTLWYLNAGGATSNSALRLLQPYIESIFCIVLLLLFHLLIDVHGKALWVRPLRFVGAISFPLYLTHVIVVDLVMKTFQKQGFIVPHFTLVLQMFSIVTLSIGLAWLIHEAIEKPTASWVRTRYGELRQH